MKKYALLITTLLFTTLSYGQITDNLSTSKDGNGFTYHYSSTDPLKTRIYTLPNGLTVYLSDYKAKPRVQTFVAVRAGSKDDPNTNTGLAHYLEHILFKGTSKIGTSNWTKEEPLLNTIESLFEEYSKIPFSDSLARKAHYAIIDSISYEASKFSIANEYDKLVSSIGANGTNAYTWFDQTVYINDIPANQIENWATIESERFSEVVPRLFHTELEAVYEEKNMGLDNDNRRVWEKVFEALYPTHPYGTQTTIGTVEHLKNPSITAIKEYFNKNYVANNMAICLSGDLDLDQTIKIISEKFSSLPSKSIERETFPTPPTITSPIIKTVTGPSAESVTLAFRFDGASTQEALLMELVSMVLSNSQAGLIDLNLNQQQKVLGAYSYPLRINDYSMHILSARPRADQSLDEVKDLLLSQLELIAEGNFPDWLLDAIITDYKLSQTNELESNKSRATSFVTNFIRNEPYPKSITEIERLEKFTKQDIIDFVKKNYSNNYVRINKVQGVDDNIKKVEKPTITPIELNRDKQSSFLQNVIASEAKPISPVFVDYKNDITTDEISINDRNLEIIYNKNVENELFDLYYIFEFGSDQNKKLSLALNYMNYLGCEGYSASELSQEFYKIGCNFSFHTSRDQLYIGITGLSQNFDKANKLLEHFLATAIPDEDAYNELVSSILKERENNKLNKSVILKQALVSYAKYGPKSPFTDKLSQEELTAIQPLELTEITKKISAYKHKFLYYGPMELTQLKTAIPKNHKLPTEIKTPKAKNPYTFQKIEDNTVYFVEYEMVQSEIIMLSDAKKYNSKRAIQAKLFNEYFGGNMGSIVFQEMRESKALAYSVRSYFQTANKLKSPNYIVSYIGCQSDKLFSAVDGMTSLLDTFISEPASFQNAKESLMNSIETSRSIKSSILFKYLSAQKLKQKKDINEKMYDYVSNSDISDAEKFHKKYLRNKDKSFLIIGSKENIDLEKVKQYGKVIELSLEDIFGY